MPWSSRFTWQCNTVLPHWRFFSLSTVKVLHRLEGWTKQKLLHASYLKLISFLFGFSILAMHKWTKALSWPFQYYLFLPLLSATEWKNLLSGKLRVVAVKCCLQGQELIFKLKLYIFSTIFESLVMSSVIWSPLLNDTREMYLKALKSKLVDFCICVIAYNFFFIDMFHC